MNISEITDRSRFSDTDIIEYLKDKNLPIERKWSELIKEYDSKKHDIMDRSKRKDKKTKNGVVPVARVRLDLEDLIVKRMAQFMFSIPVKRVYDGIGDDEVGNEIRKAIEAVYKKNRINTINLKRAKEYFATCEMCTQWYTVTKTNKDYGFNAKSKIKCKVFSPKNGYDLYPLFDNTGDMIAMSMEYKASEGGENKIFFETFTDDAHLVFVNNVFDASRSGVNKLGKIPFSYIYRNTPIWDGVEHIVDEIEQTLSRNSDVIGYNSAPIIKIAGSLQGEEEKGESRRVYRVENGGDVQYVSWSQSIEAIKFHIDILLKLMWMRVQLPDISFDNLKSTGQMNASAMRLLLTDAHLKVGDESGDVIEFLDREFNIIKAELATLNPKWKERLEDITAEHIITPFSQDDVDAQVNTLLKANGGNAIISQRESIERSGLSKDVDKTIELINSEEKQRNKDKMSSLMESAI